MKKVSINSNDLTNALQKFNLLSSKNRALPILKYLKFCISNKILTITGTDIGNTIVAIVPVLSTEDYTFLIQGNYLILALKNLKNENINIILDQDFSTTIETSKGNYSLSGEDTSSYPTTPLIESVQKIIVNASDLQYAIDKVFFAMGTDDLRPTMNGVFFEVIEDKLHLTATNANILSTINFSLSEKFQNVSFILPKSTIHILKSLLMPGQDIVLEVSTYFLRVDCEGFTIIATLIDGKFPNYRDVIPTVSDKKLTISKNLLLESLQRLRLFNESSTRVTVFSLKKDNLTITAQNATIGVKGNDIINCEYDNEDFTIGFNSSYAIDVFKSFDLSEITLEFTVPTRAVAIRENSHIAIMMPLIVNNE